MKATACAAAILVVFAVSLVTATAVSAQPVPAPGPTLTISPSSGPIGTVVQVHYNGGSECRQVVFMPVGGKIDSGTAWVGANSFFQSLDLRVVIPSFLGTSTTPVRPGRYEFAYSCGGSYEPPVPAAHIATVPFTVTAAPNPHRFVGMASTPDGHGYWLVQAGGGVFSYGDAGFKGSLPGIRITPAAPIVAITSTPDGGGYWLVGADGGVYAFGDAPFVGSIPQLKLVLDGPIIGMVSTADGHGYWLLGADGGGFYGTMAEFTFGDAPYCDPGPLPSYSNEVPPGSVVGNFPEVAASGNPQAGNTGFSEADSVGNTVIVPAGGHPCSTPFRTGTTGETEPLYYTSSQISGIAMSLGGAWLVAVDGGVFAPIIAPFFENQAPFYGSLPGLGITPQAPIVHITATPSGFGYWLLGADGGVFAFGDAQFLGAATQM